MLLQFIILAVAAVLAGAVNSVAGGGTLLTFPSLYAALEVAGGTAAQEPGIFANGTSTVALLPGALAAIWGYRDELRSVERWSFILLGPSLLGGFLGVILVTRLPESVFEGLVPWLILTASLLFALQPTIARWTGIGSSRGPASRSMVAGVVGFQFLVAVYGGYFGAGIGILMLSALAMMGFSDIHAMNGLKSLLNSCINGVAAIWFIVDGKVVWPLAIVMAVAALVGGYGGARVARRLNRNLVRGIITAIGFLLAAWYFSRQLTGSY
jgi:uncharacterized membrane protein YfcA